MSAAISPAAGRPYGVERVCRVFEYPRSSYYNRQAVERIPEAERPVLLKRGPKTPLSDEELLVEIRDDLEASPFQGKGHRKVRARLKVLKGIRVSNKRVLRLMRENRCQVAPEFPPQFAPESPPSRCDVRTGPMGSSPVSSLFSASLQ